MNLNKANKRDKARRKRNQGMKTDGYSTRFLAEILAKRAAEAAKALQAQ